MAEEEENDAAVRNLLGSGSEITGGAVGGGVGFLLGGPVGAVVGGAAGPAAAVALKGLIHEIAGRRLSKREKMRAGAVLQITADEISRRLRNGEQLRSDGFFGEGRARSDGAEVAESIVLKAQREPEERKLRYMAKLLAGTAFDANVNAELAHQLAKTAEQLTYRQLCILKLAIVKEAFGLRSTDYRGQGTFGKDLLQVLYECFDLYQRGLLNFGGSAAFGPSDVVPAGMTTQGLGSYLFNLMELREIPGSDLAPIAANLR